MFNYMLLNGKELIPFNRFILLEEVGNGNLKEEDNDNSLVCIPEDTTQKKSLKHKKQQYELYRIKSVAIDCNRNLRDCGKDKYVVVDTSMIEEVVLGDMTYKMILENHIRGIFI